MEAEKIKSIIRRLLIGNTYFICEKCYIRGSFARRDWSNLSDVDLLVISDDFCNITHQKRREIVRKSLSETELEIDPICLSNNEFNYIQLDNRSMYKEEVLEEII